MYTFVEKSENRKTGHIPVVYSGRETCPKTCAFYNDCYASSWPMNIHWGKVKTKIYDLYLKIKNLPKDTIWRYGVAGDLPGEDGEINEMDLDLLLEANDGKKGFSYTHKPLTEENVRLLRYCNDRGFTVNVSTESLEQADEARALGLPVVVVVPKKFTKQKTPGGNSVVICPAQTTKITCKECQLCAKPFRQSIVAFRAHGKVKKIEEILNGTISRTLRTKQTSQSVPEPA